MKGLLVKILARGLRLEPAKRQVVFRTRELQEGLPARDITATVGVLIKERERGVRRARRTVCSKIGLEDLLSFISRIFWVGYANSPPVPTLKRGQALGLCVSCSYHFVFVPQLYERWPFLCLFETRIRKQRAEGPAGRTRERVVKFRRNYSRLARCVPERECGVTRWLRRATE